METGGLAKSLLWKSRQEMGVIEAVSGARSTTCF